MMISDPRTTVAFTGHRTYDGAAEAVLCGVIRRLYQRGYRTFLCGMAVGFDLAAAEAVLACRKSCPELELIAVVPYAGQDAYFSNSDRRRYGKVLQAAERTITLAEGYYDGCFMTRNDYLVDHASALVAWYDGSPGGTHYTVRRAGRRGMGVVNLYRKG